MYKEKFNAITKLRFKLQNKVSNDRQFIIVYGIIYDSGRDIWKIVERHGSISENKYKIHFKRENNGKGELQAYIDTTPRKYEYVYHPFLGTEIPKDQKKY